MKSIKLLSIILILLSFSFLTSCGKKGPPTLTSFEKPAAPTLLRAIHREDKIILQWNYPKDKGAEISEFIILKSSGSGFEKISYLKNDRRSYTDPDFKEGHKYSYKIISRNFRGIFSNDSNIINLTPSQTPMPPKNISFKTEDNSLILFWEKAEDDILYNVYKSSEKGTYGLNPINTAPLSKNSFRDIFNINKPVYYTIRSQTKNEIRDEGVSSEEIIVNPSEFIPSAPKELQYFVTPDMVNLYWKEPDETWVTGYRVYRRIENQDYKLIGETQIPNFLDREKPSTKRDYRITAVGPMKEGSAAEVKGIIFIPEK